MPQTTKEFLANLYRDLKEALPALVPSGKQWKLDAKLKGRCLRSLKDISERDHCFCEKARKCDKLACKYLLIAFGHGEGASNWPEAFDKVFSNCLRCAVGLAEHAQAIQRVVPRNNSLYPKFEAGYRAWVASIRVHGTPSSSLCYLSLSSMELAPGKQKWPYSRVPGEPFDDWPSKLPEAIVPLCISDNARLRDWACKQAVLCADSPSFTPLTPQGPLGDLLATAGLVLRNMHSKESQPATLASASWTRTLRNNTQYVWGAFPVWIRLLGKPSNLPDAFGLDVVDVLLRLIARTEVQCVELGMTILLSIVDVYGGDPCFLQQKPVDALYAIADTMMRCSSFVKVLLPLADLSPSVLGHFLLCLWRKGVDRLGPMETATALSRPLELLVRTVLDFAKDKSRPGVQRASAARAMLQAMSMLYGGIIQDPCLVYCLQNLTHTTATHADWLCSLAGGIGDFGSAEWTDACASALSFLQAALLSDGRRLHQWAASLKVFVSLQAFGSVADLHGLGFHAQLWYHVRVRCATGNRRMLEVLLQATSAVAHLTYMDPEDHPLDTTTPFGRALNTELQTFNKELRDTVTLFRVAVTDDLFQHTLKQSPIAVEASFVTLGFGLPSVSDLAAEFGRMLMVSGGTVQNQEASHEALVHAFFQFDPTATFRAAVTLAAARDAIQTFAKPVHLAHVTVSTLSVAIHVLCNRSNGLLRDPSFCSRVDAKDLFGRFWGQAVDFAVTVLTESTDWAPEDVDVTSGGCVGGCIIALQQLIDDWRLFMNASGGPVSAFASSGTAHKGAPPPSEFAFNQRLDDLLRTTLQTMERSPNLLEPLLGVVGSILLCYAGCDGVRIPDDLLALIRCIRDGMCRHAKLSPQQCERLDDVLGYLEGHKPIGDADTTTVQEGPTVASNALTDQRPPEVPIHETASETTADEIRFASQSAGLPSFRPTGDQSASLPVEGGALSSSDITDKTDNWIREKILSWTLTGTPPVLEGLPNPPESARARDVYESVEQYTYIQKYLMLLECYGSLAQGLKEGQDDAPRATTWTLDGFNAEDEESRCVVVTLSNERSAAHTFIPYMHFVELSFPALHGVKLAQVTECRFSVSRARTVLTLRCRPFASASSEFAPDVRCGVRVVYNLTTLRREHAALMGLPESPHCESIIKAEVSPTPALINSRIEDTKQEYRLDKPQAVAVLSSIQRKGPSVIQGPPGAGKSTTMASLTDKLLDMRLKTSPDYQTLKVAIAASSNPAIDAVVEKLLELGKSRERPFRIVRLDSERVDPRLEHLTLDKWVEEAFPIPKDFDPSRATGRDLSNLEKKLGLKQQSLDASMQAEGIDGVDYTYLYEVKKIVQSARALLLKTLSGEKPLESLSKAIDSMRYNVGKHVLEAADVVCGTLSSFGREPAKFNLRADTVIIDEAAQSVETSCLIPIVVCRPSRIVLVGDHQQLPPTILSEVAKTLGLESSLFARFQRVRPEEVHFLSVQYRMHPDISYLARTLIYDNKLEDGPDLLRQRQADWHDDAILKPFCFFDIHDGVEEGNGSTSFVNHQEVDMAMALYSRFRAAEAELNGRIGVISMYAGQNNEMKAAFVAEYGPGILQHVEFNTVDAFQGREKDIIIVSCVRSSNGRSVGFLSDRRRINVAFSRARFSLFVLGHIETLQRAEGTVLPLVVEAASLRGCLLLKAEKSRVYGPNSLPLPDGRQPMEPQARGRQPSRPGPSRMPFGSAVPIQPANDANWGGRMTKSESPQKRRYYEAELEDEDSRGDFNDRRRSLSRRPTTSSSRKMVRMDTQDRSFRR